MSLIRDTLSRLKQLNPKDSLLQKDASDISQLNGYSLPKDKFHVTTYYFGRNSSDLDN